MDQVTVHLSQAVAPGDKDWVRGFLVRHDTLGITLSLNVNGDGHYFFPTHLIQRIEYR